MIILHEEIIQRWKDRQNNLFDTLGLKGNKHSELCKTLELAIFELKEAKKNKDDEAITIYTKKIKDTETFIKKTKDEIAYLTGATEYLRNILHDINENNKGS